MTISLGTVPAGTTIYIPFTTYSGSTGASVTTSGLAVTDIEIYKNGSTTQRASDNGYALLDTDGIDFDGITGLHGFSIDLSDNSDAGFYAVGSWYWVVVSTVTVDSQTVTFVAAVFRIGPAENTVGHDADVGAIKVVTDKLASMLVAGAGSPTDFRFLAEAFDLVGVALADALLDRDMSLGTDSGTESVRTVRQALRVLRNKWAVVGTTMTVRKEDDATASWTATVSTDPAAEPIVGSDPA